MNEDWLDDEEIEETEKTHVVNLSKEDAEMCGHKVVEYFEEFKDVTDYYMTKKEEKLMNINETFFGYGQCDEIFDGYSISPKDMNIEVIEVTSDAQNSLWNSLTQITATFPIEQMPGRALKFLVKEKTTGLYLGFIRLGSPVLNMKPRNDTLGKFIEAKDINPVVFNGTVIVPAQPFGFNMLGGKLLALICVSNELKDVFNNRYGTNIKLFETTSLYGSIKGVSQYDGLKPFIRYGGDTLSKFPMILGDELHHELLQFMIDKNPNFVKDITTGSIKLKIHMRMMRTIKNSLKDADSDYYDEFVKGLEHSESLNTQKRYYYSDYGVENVTKTIYDNTAEPVYKNGMNAEKFDLDNLIQWWTKKAQKRYEKLKSSDKLRTELEYWTPERVRTKYIDIIR